jgi:hypothetical protein
LDTVIGEIKGEKRTDTWALTRIEKSRMNTDNGMRKPDKCREAQGRGQNSYQVYNCFISVHGPNIYIDTKPVKVAGGRCLSV